jgi:hypothetical protein
VLTTSSLAFVNPWFNPINPAAFQPRYTYRQQHILFFLPSALYDTVGLFWTYQISQTVVNACNNTDLNDGVRVRRGRRDLPGRRTSRAHNSDLRVHCVLGEIRKLTAMSIHLSSSLLLFIMSSAILKKPGVLNRILFLHRSKYPPDGARHIWCVS